MHVILLGAFLPLEQAFTIRGEHAGIHILLTHRGDCPEERLIRLAADAGVRVYGLSSYDIHPGHQLRSSTVVLGYASLGEEEIRRGAKLLNECWLF